MRPILFLLFFPQIASAQQDAILADTSISWAAIFEMILPADPLDNSDEEHREMADLAVLKLQSDDKSLSRYTHHSFNALIWDNLERDDWKYFADAALTFPLTFDEMLHIVSAPDTLTTFDPETYEEKAAIVWDAHFPPYECPLLRTRQILTYNNAQAKFDIIPLAIAPAQPDGSVQFFWMKFPTGNSPGNFDFNSPDVNWAIRFVTQKSSPPIINFQVIKGGEKPIAERLFELLGADTSIAIYTYSESKHPASTAERNAIFQIHTDTVATLNLKTDQEEFEIVSRGYRPEEIVDIQIIEEWVWDRKRQLPFVRLRGIAPRIIKKSGWHAAIFYLKTGE